MRSAWANLRSYPGRFVAVLLAIAIGVGFAIATLIFTASFRTDLISAIGAAASKVDVIAYPNVELTADDPRLAGLPGVAAVDPKYVTGVDFATASARGYATVDSVPTDPSMRWFSLTDGSWPTGLDQVVIDAGTATRNGLTVGSALSLATVDGSAVDATVVGTISLQQSTLLGQSDGLFVSPDLGASLTGGMVAEFDLRAADGVSADAVAATVRDALGTDAEVQTSTTVVARQVDVVLGQADVLTPVLLTFAAIAGLVASFVIANTFTILLAQRQRQIGLLRCVGASRDQVRRSVLAEALLVGVIGSVAGALLGAGGGWAAMAVADIRTSSFTVSPLPVAAALVVGVLVTVLAALAPSARAMRVSPLAALSAVPTGAESRRSGRLRVAAGAVLAVAGTVGLVGGIALPSLLVAAAGGAVSSVGVLLLLRSVLPWVLRGIGRLARLGGVPGQLAAANAERNPGRAAATSSALVIAVGLIVTLQVAAGSARSSLDASLSERFPLDLSVSTTRVYSDNGAASELPSLPAGLIEQIRGVDGVTAIALNGTSADLQLPDEKSPFLVLGAPDDVGTVIRSEAPAAGTVAVPSWLVTGYGFEYGQAVSFTSANATISLTLVESRLAAGQSAVAVVNQQDLARLDPAAAPMAIWGQLADIDDANDVISRVTPILAPLPAVVLGGAAVDHASIAEGLSNVLLVVTALLAVAAVIAVVGIGNTLGLSVVERTRESALLRALGLRRGQLRLMLAVEAALLAAVGTVVGVVLGTGYGWAGALATFGEAGEASRLAFPVGEVLLVVALALLAGVAASVLPARRAAMAAPTEALADV